MPIGGAGYTSLLLPCAVVGAAAATAGFCYLALPRSQSEEPQQPQASCPPPPPFCQIRAKVGCLRCIATSGCPRQYFSQTCACLGSCLIMQFCVPQAGAEEVASEQPIISAASTSTTHTMVPVPAEERWRAWHPDAVNDVSRDLKARIAKQVHGLVFGSCQVGRTRCKAGAAAHPAGGAGARSARQQGSGAQRSATGNLGASGGSRGAAGHGGPIGEGDAHGTCSNHVPGSWLNLRNGGHELSPEVAVPAGAALLSG